MPQPSELAKSQFKYAEQGSRLRQLRQRQKMSQSELSRAAQISMSTLVKLESGERVPGTEVKERLAAVLEAAGAGASAEVMAIDWPTPYAAQSYNHRQPVNAAPGSPGDRLKELRLAQGVKQAEIALRLGMTEQKYGRLERGYSKQISRTVLEKLTTILGEGVKELGFSILR